MFDRQKSYTIIFTKPARMTFWIIVVTSLVYALGIDAYSYAAYPSDIFENPFRPYSLISYQFFHVDFSHLFMNMLYLFIFGRKVERFIGGAWYLFFYLSSGCVAALVQFAIPPISSDGLIGASGSVSAMLGASLVHMREVHGPFVIRFAPISWPLRFFIIYWLIGQIFGLVMRDDHVAWHAHLGGFAFGFLFFVLMAFLGAAKRIRAPSVRKGASRIPNSE